MWRSGDLIIKSIVLSWYFDVSTYLVEHHKGDSVATTGIFTDIFIGIVHKCKIWNLDPEIKSTQCATNAWISTPNLLF